MPSPTDKEADQHEAFFRLCESIMKLAEWRDFLTQPQCVALAETLRDLADIVDLGEGQRAKKVSHAGPGKS